MFLANSWLGVSVLLNGDQQNISHSVYSDREKNFLEHPAWVVAQLSITCWTNTTNISPFQTSVASLYVNNIKLIPGLEAGCGSVSSCPAAFTAARSMHHSGQVEKRLLLYSLINIWSAAQPVMKEWQEFYWDQIQNDMGRNRGLLWKSSVQLLLHTKCSNGFVIPLLWLSGICPVG